MIEESGGNLISTQALPGRDDEAYPRVTVKVRMQADMNALQAVLYQLMINRPLLFTDNMMIQRRNIAPGPRDSGAGLLEVHFDVSGYRRGGLMSASSPALQNTARLILLIGICALLYLIWTSFKPAPEFVR